MSILTELNDRRISILAMKYRPSVVHFCELLAREWAERDEIEACPYGEDDAANLLAEWDSVNTPNQVPEPIRRLALERLKTVGVCP